MTPDPPGHFCICSHPKSSFHHRQAWILQLTPPATRQWCNATRMARSCQRPRPEADTPLVPTATHLNAEADVENVATRANPTSVATTKRFIIVPPCLSPNLTAGHRRLPTKEGAKLSVKRTAQ